MGKNLIVNKRTKLIGTIGPSSNNKEVMEALILNGMTTIRANFSHGSYDEQLNKFVLAREIQERLQIPISIMLDTKGPEIRVGEMEDGVQEIKGGIDLVIYCNEEDYKTRKGNTKDGITVSYRMDLDLKIGDKVLFDDGKLVSVVTSLDQGKGIVNVKTKNPHKLKSNKRINLPGVDFSLPFLAEKDVEDIKFGINKGIDFVAASFVNNAKCVKQIKTILEANGGSHIKVISKIESQTGCDNIDEIIEASDGIMVARGDLGLEIPYYEVPYWQKQMIQKCRKAGKIVIVATQMLDSMERVPQPTRAEVSDVYWATEVGADSTMLSGETASGDFPIDAVQVMSAINKRAEIEKYKSQKYLDDIKDFYERSPKDERNQIAYDLAKKVAKGDYKYAVVCSESGKLLQTIAQYRPNCSVIGVVHKKEMITQFGITYSIFVCMNSLEIYDDVRKNPENSHKALNAYSCEKGSRYLYVRGNKTTEGVY